MKNKLLFLASLFLIVGCGFNSTSEQVSLNSSSLDNSLLSLSSEKSVEISSFDSSISLSEEVSTGFISDTEFKISDAYNSLALAVLMDEDYSSITVQRYTIREKYYQTQSYKMTSYLNNFTLYNGTTVLTYYNDYENKLVSNFKEQRCYENGIYTQIRKFDSTFTNSAYRIETDEENALLYLDIGQSLSVYSVLSTFEEYYPGRFEGEILENGDRHGTFFYQDYASSDEYPLTAAIEFKLDSSFHLIDFYYTEGYFDGYFVNDVSSARSHGPSSYGGDGYTYEMTMVTKGEKIQYTFDYPFKNEDNFISSLMFKNEELTISISSHKLKYINLIDYIKANIEIGFTSGAPVNNLVFTSSNEDVAVVADVYYCDFVSPGETIISVKDSAYGITSTNTLKLILTE